MDYAPLEKKSPTVDSFLQPRRDSSLIQEAQASSSFGLHLHAAICVGLHVFLILVHIGLLVVCLGRYEQSITFALTPFSVEWLPLIVTTAMQLLGTIFLTILVAITQTLAFRRDIYVRQTLTALHDKSTAWLGLGSASLSLWRQFKLRAAMVGVLYITAYLLGIWMLHITIPAVLDVVPYNATVSTVNQTTLANVTTTAANFASAYDILPVYDQVPMLGLQDNMVYDVIPQVAYANGTTAVNASVYDVDCAAFPTPPGSFNSTGVQSVGFLPETPTLEIEAYLQNHLSFSAPLPYSGQAVFTARVNEIQSADVRGSAYMPGCCWVPILVLSTVSIVDSAGNQSPVPGGPWIPINPQFISPYPASIPAVMITAVQAAMCSVRISNIKLDVSVETRAPVDTTPKPLPHSVWKSWTWPDDLTLTDQLRTAQYAPYFSPPSAHSSSMPIIDATRGNGTGYPPSPPVILEDYQPSLVPQTDGVQTGRYNVVPTAFDVFLTEDLRVVSENRSSITLAELERTLGRALAATFWYGNTVNYNKSHAVGGLVQPQNSYYDIPSLSPNATNTTSTDLPRGEATIMVLVQRLRLNLSLVPIIIGLATSAVLLVVCVLAIHVPRSARSAFDPRVRVDSGGLLQFTWLLGHEPHLAQVDSPEVDNLRAAGMFDVQMIDRVRQRQSSLGEGDDGSIGKA